MLRPLLIQGGMGAGVSGWRLASAVSRAGQLGVVAGTALDAILVRRLQEGDEGGHLRRAMASFPDQGIVQRALERYFIDGGKAPEEPYSLAPMHSLHPPRELIELTVLANYAEVWLAKEGHAGIVGVNYLEKIQLPNPASLYGAMLAGVDAVLVGAGIPREIPGVLDALAAGRPASLRVAVAAEAPGEEHRIEFDARSILERPPTSLRRPVFLAIVASYTLAAALVKRSPGRVDGFVVEGHVAGGHNAPPRGRMEMDETGQPIYGSRDAIDPAAFRTLGLPFWLAGGYGYPERLAEALAVGATGVQVGTPFAFCNESALDPALRTSVLQAVRAGTARVVTDPVASPTGFPFKIFDAPDTLSRTDVYARRPRICDLGYLRTAYRNEDGRIGFRCPGEPIATYVAKGGNIADTAGRRCLCNGLVAAIGLGQRSLDGYQEPPILTSGADLSVLQPYLAETTSYSAADVIARLCPAVG